MAARFQFSNVYLVSGLATLGGMMQGFDVASMSAIIGTSQVGSFTRLLGHMCEAYGFDSIKLILTAPRLFCRVALQPVWPAARC